MVHAFAGAAQACASTWFSNASLEILINSNQLGPSFTTPDTTGIWEQTSREWNSSLATTATIEIVNASTGFTGNDFALDDISFTNVPEPSSGVLLLASSIVAFRRRRASSQNRRKSTSIIPASGRTVVPVVAAALALAAPLASADVIPGLFNTGVNDSLVVKAIGDDETHYSVSGPSAVNQAITPNPAWVTSSSANWIGPISGASNAPVGTYEYVLSFDLTGFDLSTVIITGDWASDNESVVLLNGQATGLFADTLPFQELTPLFIDSDFVAGENTITFQVTNVAGFSPNPTGLLVSNLQGTGDLVPEPSSAVLLLGMTAIIYRRRR